MISLSDEYPFISGGLRMGDDAVIIFLYTFCLIEWQKFKVDSTKC